MAAIFKNGININSEEYLANEKAKRQAKKDAANLEELDLFKGHLKLHIIDLMSSFFVQLCRNMLYEEKKIQQYEGEGEEDFLIKYRRINSNLSIKRSITRARNLNNDFIELMCNYYTDGFPDYKKPFGKTKSELKDIIRQEIKDISNKLIYE